MKKRIRLLLLPICLLASCGNSSTGSESVVNPSASTSTDEKRGPFSLLESQYYINKNKSGRINYALKGCEQEEVSFQSSKEDIVSVDNEGNFTGHQYGSAKITIRVFDYVYEARVTVYRNDSILGRWNYYNDDTGISGTFEFSDVSEGSDRNWSYYHLNVEKFIGNTVDHYDFKYWTGEATDGSISVGSEILDPWVEGVVSTDRNDVYMDGDPYVNYVSTYIYIDSVNTEENTMNLYMGVQIGFDNIDPEDRTVTWNAIFGVYTNQAFNPYDFVTFTRA